MKNIIVIFSFIFCISIVSATAQNATRGSKSSTTTAKSMKTTPCIPNFTFSKARSMNELKEMEKKGITETAMLQQEAAQQAETAAGNGNKQYVRRVGIAANIPGNYMASKTTTPEYNPTLKSAAVNNPRVSQSQPINIHKSVKSE